MMTPRASGYVASVFTATTLGAIAADAGVSVETVQAHGPKKRLLLAALEAASAGVDGGRSILDVPEAQAVLAEENAREGLLGLASFAAELNGRIGRLWQAMAVTLWLPTSPYQHEHLVVQSGWAPERYLGWLQRMLLEAALRPDE